MSPLSSCPDGHVKTNRTNILQRASSKMAQTPSTWIAGGETPLQKGLGTVGGLRPLLHVTYHKEITELQTAKILERVPHTKCTWHPIYKPYGACLKNYVFIKNACTLSLLKLTFLTYNWYLETNWLLKRKMSAWNSFQDFFFNSCNSLSCKHINLYKYAVALITWQIL